ncbi:MULTISPECIES: site-specific DNA-methyltransferase [Dehalobacter]|uniref:Site-specific DNA-methyltransferase n=2 Tax=Dehalobacter restrictus TaxID=55583 RepID=A0A857DFQ0_9FIRM|nr:MULTISPECIES: site-specific DNA-methyltransferase [Dehalobacter]AHF09007.1 DNA-cytosine methyltransferase [Dehalobacter restrictus DSM 9455]MCG1024992.1 site-specific DNA-methyltransferase [Dehalobacter sp.]QGZ99530.1 site-specific DNA-methyltransferase [Dehalobacter restrictus]
MSTNISKHKRDDLVNKIKAIRSYIASSYQDENTGNLLTYLSELEKEIKAKKYGLVFEEHRERIDKLLDTHTPLLTEERNLFIDNGGLLNFLIEGDNLATLQLLTKTHRGKIDLIYIDPPYNMGKDDFVYDDNFVDKEDGFRHSKWLSFMERRLTIARNLLTPNGVLVISIGYHELNNLILLCENLFFGKQVVTVTVQTSGGKPSGGFNYLQEYLVFVTPQDFKAMPTSFAGGNTNAPFHGMNLATFDQTQRPNQAYPIYINKETGQVVGCGLSLTDRVRNGSYTGELRDFKFDYEEAPEGCVAVWPVSNKGIPCIWRLIASRLMRDLAKGYIKVIKQKASRNKNQYAIQFLAAGIISKIESGEVSVAGRETSNQTIILGDYKSEGVGIPTIWTEKVFYTAKGSSQILSIFGNKKFTYPKPMELIQEVIRACCASDSTILDFFAGSGTTGHSVMGLNEEGGTGHRFILCTNNENNICRDITYERMKRVIDKEGYAASLKYYKVDFVPISERMYYEYADELLRHVRELVELENGINFTGNAELAIVLTDEELDGFTRNINVFKKCRKLYLGHDVLLSGEQEALLKEQHIQVNIIPDYYYKELEG